MSLEENEALLQNPESLSQVQGLLEEKMPRTNHPQGVLPYRLVPRESPAEGRASQGDRERSEREKSLKGALPLLQHTMREGVAWQSTAGARRGKGGAITVHLPV